MKGTQLSTAQRALLALLLCLSLLWLLSAGVRFLEVYPTHLARARTEREEAQHVLDTLCTENGVRVARVTMDCARYEGMARAGEQSVALGRALRNVLQDTNVFQWVDCGKHSVCKRVFSRLVDTAVSGIVVVAAVIVVGAGLAVYLVYWLLRRSPLWQKLHPNGAATWRMDSQASIVDIDEFDPIGSAQYEHLMPAAPPLRARPTKQLTG